MPNHEARVSTRAEASTQNTTNPGELPRIMVHQELTFDQWQSKALTHRERIGKTVDPLLELRTRGIAHPVWDFMFSYYSLSPGHLKRWHPGPGILLLDQDQTPSQQSRPEGSGQWKNYRHVTTSQGTGWVLDTEEFVRRRGSMLGFAHELIAATKDRRAQLSCFGLHEWAMAYRSDKHGIRHSTVPLRLGAKGTDAVVESHKISCTHYDAFRFYAPEARPLNTIQPTRERAIELEQPGCLHANMDLYRHCGKLLPLINSDLLADTFELAWEIRLMDMQASPYDLSEWELEPIRIETTEGKAQYVAAQREFSERSQLLRDRIVQVLSPYAMNADDDVAQETE